MPTTKGDSEAPEIDRSNTTTSGSSGDNSVAFSKWRESNINDDDYIRGDTNAVPAKSDGDDDGVDPAFFFRMFGEDDDEDVFEEVRYEYKTTTTTASSTTTPSAATTVAIRHHGAYPNSTGLAVWRGSEILARFLCDQQQRSCENDNNDRGVVAMRRKKVLEIGAGGKQADCY